MTELERFHESYVPVTESGCWIWIKALLSHGYGGFALSRPTRKRLVLAHRFSYSTLVGDIPKGMCVLHRCDVTSCVNPAHLWLGTIRDNSIDMVIKGRKRGGWPRKDRPRLA